MDGVTGKRWCIIACLAFFYITKDGTTDALHCYSCNWTSNSDKCDLNNEIFRVYSIVKLEPVPDKCIKTSYPPTKKTLEDFCSKQECLDPTPACMTVSDSWIGRPRNLVYGCTKDIGGGRMTIYTIDDRGQPVAEEMLFCKDNYCNGELKSSVSDHPINASQP